MELTLHVGLEGGPGHIYMEGLRGLRDGVGTNKERNMKECKGGEERDCMKRKLARHIMDSGVPHKRPYSGIE